jgi:hypothetical protein
LPRLKDELLKVAALLNITTSADVTVEVLKSQISPTVKELLSKPIPYPKSQGIRPMPVRRPVLVVKLDKDKSMEAEMLEEAGDRLLLGQEFWQGGTWRVELNDAGKKIRASACGSPVARSLGAKSRM